MTRDDARMELAHLMYVVFLDGGLEAAKKIHRAFVLGAWWQANQYVPGMLEGLDDLEDA